MREAGSECLLFGWYKTISVELKEESYGDVDLDSFARQWSPDIDHLLPFLHFKIGLFQVCASNKVQCIQLVPLPHLHS